MNRGDENRSGMLRGRMLLLAGIGVVVALALRQISIETVFQTPNEGQGSREEKELSVAPPPEKIAKPHLEWAERKSLEAVDVEVEAIGNFFREAKSHTGAFAEDALGFSSKMKLVWDSLPFLSNVHEAFIREKFEEHLFAPQQLEEMIEGVVKDFLRREEEIESEMLVRLRSDMADFPNSYSISRLDSEEMQKSYERWIAQAVRASSDDLTSSTSELLVSTAVGEVLTVVALRMGVSAGILGAGGASGGVTFGVGVLVGLIVDQVVASVWDWYADPRGNLSMALNSKLDDLSVLILSGEEGRGGLKEQLRKVAEERTKVRREAVLHLLEVQ